jgi:hypothetical protein
MGKNQTLGGSIDMKDVLSQLMEVLFTFVILFGGVIILFMYGYLWCLAFMACIAAILTYLVFKS